MSKLFGENSKWIDWKVTVVSFLSTQQSRYTVPLSYVVGSNNFPRGGANASENDRNTDNCTGNKNNRPDEWKVLGIDWKIITVHPAYKLEVAAPRCSPRSIVPNEANV